MLKNLQSKIGVVPDGEFGPATLRAAEKYFGLSRERSAHFFGQCAHESAEFTVFEENLNYSAAGLRKIFGKYFTSDALAAEYARKPQRIASRVYACRMGNGTEASGDGWNFRGRGAIQLTGKSNYSEFSVEFPAVLENPSLVASELAFESAKFFFDRNNLWSICDRGVTTEVITQVSRRVNGGTIGLEDRIAKTLRYYKW